MLMFRGCRSDREVTSCRLYGSKTGERNTPLHSVLPYCLDSGVKIVLETHFKNLCLCIRITWAYHQNRASQVVQQERIRLRMQETQVQSLGWEDLLEDEMATHSSILAWEIPWTEEHGGLQSSWGHKELDMTERVCARTHTHTHTHQKGRFQSPISHLQSDTLCWYFLLITIKVML